MRRELTELEDEDRRRAINFLVQELMISFQTRRSSGLLPSPEGCERRRDL
jgi:hypothetical protein